MRIAIVDDESSEAKKLQTYLERYARENDVVLSSTVFHNAVVFVANYKPVYDLVFLDVDMPAMNGMQCAREIRRADTVTILVFVTKLPQFAAMGYEVDALDYIVKPVEYSSFALKMRRAILRASQNKKKKIKITTEDGLFCCECGQIRYLEMTQHMIVYHTTQGEFRRYGTLKSVLSDFPPDVFVLCNSGTLVNLQYVTGIVNQTLQMGKESIPISRAKKKELVKRLNMYLGGAF